MIAVEAQGLPTIAVLSTGGTIASQQDPDRGGYLPALSGEDLVSAVPEIQKIARIQVEQIANIPSHHMTPAIWVCLASRVNELLTRAEVAGIVITHGTDTLEETAYFLDLTTPGEKPVILVGAQRPASDADSDGPRNLLDAICVAACHEAINKGVMVVMNGRIDAAREVTKTNTHKVDSFRSPEFGELGVVGADGVSFYRAPVRGPMFAVDRRTELPRVDIVMSYAGADGLLVQLLARESSVKGLVVAGVGLGNVSDSMFDAIREVRAQGLPVVVSTRVPTGRVFPLNAAVGGLLSLKEIGCVSAGNLSPQKARVLLMLALVREVRDSFELQKYFDQ